MFFTSEPEASILGSIGIIGAMGLGANGRNDGIQEEEEEEEAVVGVGVVTCAVGLVPTENALGEEQGDTDELNESECEELGEIDLRGDVDEAHGGGVLILRPRGCRETAALAAGAEFGLGNGTDAVMEGYDRLRDEDAKDSYGMDVLVDMRLKKEEVGEVDVDEGSVKGDGFAGRLNICLTKLVRFTAGSGVCCCGS